MKYTEKVRVKTDRTGELRETAVGRVGVLVRLFQSVYSLEEFGPLQKSYEEDWKKKIINELKIKELKTKLLSSKLDIK